MRTLFSQWYRSLLADGTIWSESSSLDDALQPGPSGELLRVEVMQVWHVTDPWQPLPDRCCGDCTLRCDWKCRCHGALRATVTE